MPLNLTYVKASEVKAEELANIRVEAMRPSLLAVGRFDPDRAKRRFLDTFSASDTTIIQHGTLTIGFFVLRRRPNDLYLDHLYVLHNYQRLGVGGNVIKLVKDEARPTQKPIRLMALKGSPANQFYLRLEFCLIQEDEFDNHYMWNPQ